MAAGMIRDHTHVRPTGSICRVPDHPVGRLMYYLSACESIVSFGIPSQYRDYHNYEYLSARERTEVVKLAVLLDPELFIRHGVMIQHDGLCGDCNNEFYEITNTRIGVAVSRSFLIGGQQVRTLSVMTFKRAWMENNYYGPLREIRRAIEEAESRTQYRRTVYKSHSGGGCCNVQ